MYASSRLVAIPELLLGILAQLESSKYDDTPVKTLVRCLRVSRAFAEVAKTDSLWVSHYYARYRYTKAAVTGRPDTNPELENQGSGAWYKQYVLSRMTDLRVVELLSDIISTPSKRGESILELARLGGDALDPLRIEAACRVPSQLKQVWAGEERDWRNERWEGIGEEWSPDGVGKETDADGLEGEDTRVMTDDWMQRRWWAKQALGTIARAAAVRTLSQVFWGRKPDRSSRDNAKLFEEGLKALSGLMGANVAEISRNYDHLAAECARHLKTIGICVDPHSPEFDLKVFSAGVCDWMRSQGFKHAEDDTYYHLMNHFPHTFMTTNRQTLPLSLVYTFVAIVTRLGLCAAPVGFPAHVHAWVYLPGAESDDDTRDWEEDTPTRRLAVDVFNSDKEPFRHSDAMRNVLDSMGIPRSDQSLWMRPAMASDMVERAANNILNSAERLHHHGEEMVPREVRGAGLYTASVALLIARPEAANALQLVALVVGVVREYFPLDIDPILAQELAPILDRNQNESIGMHLRSIVELLRGAVIGGKQKPQQGKRLWWVGMVFRHLRYGYIGVVLDCDEKCMAGEEWIRQMGVDSLARGGSQPFYTVLATDGSSRYVAEDNIIPLPVPEGDAQRGTQDIWETVRMLMEAGTWKMEQTFSRVEVNEELGRAWFVPGVDTARTYPGDTEMGRVYIQGLW